MECVSAWDGGGQRTIRRRQTTDDRRQSYSRLEYTKVAGGSGSRALCAVIEQRTGSFHTMHTIRVLLALGPYAVSFLRDRRRWIWWGGPMPHSPEVHARRARRLVEAIIRLGPTFVKMAQVFAARADLIPEPYLTELGKLIDQVPPLSFDTVAGIVAESYHGNGPDSQGMGAARVDEVFEAFERVPVAAASLGQVHRARYKGEVVAVKVLRPGVETAVKADLIAARRILSWVERYWKHPHV